MKSLTGCPLCGDNAHYESINHVYCCTRSCKNYCSKQEAETLSGEPEYFILCFCDECIFCCGKIKQFDRFRFKNVNYALFFGQFNPGYGTEDYLIAAWGNSSDSTTLIPIEMFDSFPELLENEKRYEPLIEGYKLFKDFITKNPDFLDHFLDHFLVPA